MTRTFCDHCDRPLDENGPHYQVYAYTGDPESDSYTHRCIFCDRRCLSAWLETRER